jgi:hypothetical protein
MNSNSTNAFTKTAAITAILFVIAAPVLQAVSFAGEFTQLAKSCGCCCCATPDQESNCPVKFQITVNDCPCSVTESLPFNSKPLESSTPNQTAKHFYIQSFAINNLFESIKPVSSEIFAFDVVSKTHPPFYILNASLLI